MYSNHDPGDGDYRDFVMDRSMIEMQDDSIVCDETIFDVDPYSRQGDCENERPQCRDVVFGRSLPNNFAYQDDARRRSCAFSKPLEIPIRPAQSVRPNSSPNTASSFNNSMFSFKATSLEEMAEKQRRRKESHNAVERRRRDHINEMIQRLSRLVSNGSDATLNKGEVLERAANKIDLSNKIIDDLMGRLRDLGDEWRPLEYEEYIRGAETQRGIDPRQFY